MGAGPFVVVPPEMIHMLSSYALTDDWTSTLPEGVLLINLVCSESLFAEAGPSVSSTDGNDDGSIWHDAERKTLKEEQRTQGGPLPNQPCRIWQPAKPTTSWIRLILCWVWQEKDKSKKVSAVVPGSRCRSPVIQRRKPLPRLETSRSWSPWRTRLAVTKKGLGDAPGNVAIGQNCGTLVNIKIDDKWMFIHPNMAP